MSINVVISVIFFIINIGLGVYSFKNYFNKLKNKGDDIREITSYLQTLNKEYYTYQFETINKKLLDNQTISGIWSDFSKTLTKWKNPQGGDELYSTVEAREYFRYNTVVNDINDNFWQNYGSIFTGVGILGTFLGLVMGLNGVDLSSSDVNVLKEGIGTLLQGISVAFTTSLFGIFFALIYGYFNKARRTVLSDDIEALAKRIEEMYPRKNTEQWLSDGHRESVEQTKVLKNMGQDMAETLSDLLDKQLSSGFEELCQTLDAQMKPMFEKLYEAIKTLNEGGASAVGDAVSKKAGEQLDSFVDTLKIIQETMVQNLESNKRANEEANAALMNAVVQIGDSLSKGTDEAVKRQQEAAELLGEQVRVIVNSLNESSTQTMDNLLESSNLIQQGLGYSVEQSKSAVEQINSIIANHKETIEQSCISLSEITDKLDNVLKQVDISSEKMKMAALPIVEATTELNNQLSIVQQDADTLHKETINQIERLMKYGEDTESSISNLADTIDDAEQKAIEAWEKYDNGMSGLGAELGNILSSLIQKVNEYNQVTKNGMNEQLTRFDNSMTNAVAQLKAVIDEISELVNELTSYNEGRN